MTLFMLAQQTSITPTNWSELTALGCVLVAFVWGLTKGAPTLINKFTATIETLEASRAEEQKEQSAAYREEQRLTREAFTAKLETQHNDFRDDMRTHREQSNRLASGGHEAVNNLAGSFEALQNEIRELRKEKTAESGIHKS